MEKLILQSIKDWENIFDNITEMITVHDADFNIIYANKIAKKILKMPNDFNKPVKCYEFYHGTKSKPVGCPSCNCI